VADAEARLKKFSFFGSGSKFEEACEMYEKAGNCYKVEEKWQEAGDAYMKAADLHQNKVRGGERNGSERQKERSLVVCSDD